MGHRTEPRPARLIGEETLQAAECFGNRSTLRIAKFPTAAPWAFGDHIGALLACRNLRSAPFLLTCGFPSMVPLYNSVAWNHRPTSSDQTPGWRAGICWRS